MYMDFLAEIRACGSGEVEKSGGMVRGARIELATPAMSTLCSTTELTARPVEGPHKNQILLFISSPFLKKAGFGASE